MSAKASYDVINKAILKYQLLIENGLSKYPQGCVRSMQWSVKKHAMVHQVMPCEGMSRNLCLTHIWTVTHIAQGVHHAIDKCSICCKNVCEKIAQTLSMIL